MREGANIQHAIKPQWARSSCFTNPIIKAVSGRFCDWASNWIKLPIAPTLIAVTNTGGDCSILTPVWHNSWSVSSLLFPCISIRQRAHSKRLERERAAVLNAGLGNHLSVTCKCMNQTCYCRLRVGVGARVDTSCTSQPHGSQLCTTVF